MVGGKNFRAWLSDEKGSNARDRIGPNPDRAYVRSDGNLIATSLADLLNTPFSNPININEKGSQETGSNYRVWTGSNYKGELPSPGAATCQSWTSSNAVDFGVKGDYRRVDERWSDDLPPYSCMEDIHLYCIEVLSP